MFVQKQLCILKKTSRAFWCHLRTRCFSRLLSVYWSFTHTHTHSTGMRTSWCFQVHLTNLHCFWMVKCVAAGTALCIQVQLVNSETKNYKGCLKWKSYYFFLFSFLKMHRPIMLLFLDCNISNN